MAQSILLKRSSVAGNVPGSSDLSLGEIAINTADGAVYIKKGNNDIVAVHDNDILHIDTTNGRVGIGTTSPLNTLTIDGDIRIRDSIASLYLQDSDGTNQVTELKQSTGTTTLSSRNNTSNGSIVFTGYNGSSSIQYAKFDSSGNFGIGTTAPGSLLHVYDGNIQLQSPSGSGGRYISLNNTHTGGRDYRFISTSDSHGSLGGGDFAILDNDISGNDAAKTRLLIDSSGNIGIGTTSPANKLSVNVSADAEGIDLLSNNTKIGAFNRTVNGSTVVASLDGVTGRAINIGGHVNTSVILGAAGGNVGIGTTSPSKLLHLSEAADGSKLRLTRGGVSEWDFSIGNSSTLTGVGSGALEILPQNSGTANELAIGTAGSTAPLVHITNSQNYFSKKVGIGEISPETELHVKGTNNSAGDQYTQVGPGNTPSITIQNAGTTDNNNAALYFRDNDGMRASVGARFINHTTNEAELRFSTTDSSGNTRERLTLKGSGALRINNAYTLPTADGSANQVLKTDGSGNITFATVAGASGGTSISDSDGDTKIQVEESSDEDIIRFDTAGSQRMVILANGNVGINSGSPGAKLTVHGSTLVELPSSSNSFRIKDTQNNVERFRVTQDGYVGIGDTTPSAKLHVSGDGRIAIFGDDSFDDKYIEFREGGTTGFRLGLRTNFVDTSGDILLTCGDDKGFGIVTDTTSAWSSVATSAVNFYVSQGGNVGIGTTSPSAKLEILSDGSAAGGAEIRLQHANNNTNDVVSTINFANNAGSVAMIQGGTAGANNTGYISFFTDNAGTSAEHMRIDGNGSLFISSTSDSGSNRHFFQHDGFFRHVRSGQIVGVFDRLSTDGNIVHFRKDGADVGAIGTVDADLTIFSTASGHKGLRFGNGYIAPTGNSTAVENGTTDLGLSTQKFKDLHLSGNANIDGEIYAKDANSATDPTYAFTGHTDTGMGMYHSNSQDQLSLITDGVQRAYFNTAGITSFANVYTSSTGAFRNYGGVWHGTTGLANNGFYFLNTANSNTTKAMDLSHDGNVVFAGEVEGASLDINGVADISGNLTVGGNLTVNGTQTILNTATLDVEDKNITLNKGSGDTSGSADGAGITIQDAVDASTDASLTWRASDDKFIFSHPLRMFGQFELPDNVKMVAGDGNDLQIYHNGSQSVITHIGSGDLRIDGNSIWIRETDGTNQISAYQGTAKLYKDGTERLATTSTGVTVAGSLKTDRIECLDDSLDTMTFIDLDMDTGGSSGTNNLVLGAVNNADFLIDTNNNSTTGAFVFGTNANTMGSATELMRLNESGQLGIGTNSPSHLLHVTGADGSIANMVVNNDNVALRMSAYTNSHGEIRVETNHPLVFKTNGNNERMRIKADGNIGIGTTSPATTLEVVGENVRLRDASSGTYFQAIDTDGSHNAGYFMRSGSHNWYNLVDTAGKYQIYDGDASSIRLIIDGSGNVGIGDNNPAFKFHVKGAASAYAAGDNIISVFESETDHATYLKVKNLNGNTGASAPRAGIDLDVPNHQTGSGARARAQFVVRSIASNGSGGDASITVPKDLRFFVNNKGTLDASSGEQASSSNVAGTEAMRITDQGNVGIGTTSPADGLELSHVNPKIRIRESDVTNGFADILYNSTRLRIRSRNDATNGAIAFEGQAGSTITEYARFNNVGNFGIGTTSPSTKLQVEEYGVDTTSTSSSATTQIAIHSFAAATFRSARFTVQVTNSTDSTYHTTELLLVHDGSTANITEFGEIHTGSAVEATFDSDVNSGNVRLLATPASTDTMAFKVVCHSITA